MEVISLQSGSSGNSTYVESGGVKLIFDAGISGRQAEQRLADHGKNIRDVDALIISHDHRDHTCCMGIYQRKFGLPIYITRRTFEATRRRMNLGHVNDIRYFGAGESIEFGHISVETLRTPHDAADGVAFVIDDSLRRFGVLTDLGHVFEDLKQAIGTLDAVLIESNYDVSMLRGGPYPEFLKKRISGASGHISNLDAARLLKTSASPRLQWACLAHLSDENNDPKLAIQTHHEILGAEFPITCADRQTATGVMSVAECFDRNPGEAASPVTTQQSFSWSDQ